MKKFFLLAFLFFLISALSIYGVNLIQNPGFENWTSGSPDNWHNDSGDIIYQNSDTVHSGSYSARVVVTTGTQASTDFYTDTINVESSTDYTYSFYVFHTDTTIKARLALWFYDKDGNYVTNYYGSYSTAGSNWQELTHSFTTDTNVVKLICDIRFYDQTGFADSAVVFVDDADLEGPAMGNNPPTISDVTRTPTNPDSGQVVNVSANITDDYGLSDEKMYYKYNSASYAAVSSDSVSGSTFYFHAPSGNTDDTLYYYIYALDDSSASSYSDTFSVVIGSQNVVGGDSILFDFTKDEDAGNADWVIDNNMPYPSPANPTSESDWLGAISSWAFELDTAGYFVATLPPDSAITYGNSSHPLDLSHFKVFVVCEPQNPFTSAEKEAIYDFMRAGGGVFLVSDHNSSDRNNNGWDAVRVFNDMGLKDSVGIHCDTTGESNNSISDNSTNYNAGTSGDPIFHGPFGDITGPLCFHSGSTMQISGAASGEVWYSSVAIGANNGVMMATSHFGNGRIILITDSSPADDSTGNSGNTLYDGWNEGDDRLFFLNGTVWLTGYNGPAGVIKNINDGTKYFSMKISNNIIKDKGNIKLNIENLEGIKYKISLYNIAGKRISDLYSGCYSGELSIKMPNVIPGIYFLKSDIKESNSLKIAVIK